jgi:hypothetical protein
MSITDEQCSTVNNCIRSLQHSPTSSTLRNLSSGHCKTDLIIITKGTDKNDCKRFTTALKKQIKVVYLKREYSESSK